jgi:hypothetical protein
VIATWLFSIWQSICLGNDADHHRDSLPVAHIAGGHAADQGTVAGGVGRTWRLHTV